MKKNYNDLIETKKVNIICTIFIIFCFICIVASSFQYINGEIPFGAFVLSFLITVPIIIVLFRFIYRNIVYTRKNQETTKLFINYGTRVPGIIKNIDYCRNYKYKDSIFKRSHFFSEGIDKIAIVEFKYNGEKHTIKSPPINFSESMLRDKKVNVYIYQDKYYIDDYNLEQESTFNNKEEEKNIEKRYIISFFTFFILFVIIGVLNNNKIIDDKMTKIALISLVISYGIVWLICVKNDLKHNLNKLEKLSNKKDVIETEENDSIEKEDK